MKRMLAGAAVVVGVISLTLTVTALAHRVQRASVAEFEVLGSDFSDVEEPAEPVELPWVRPSGPPRVGLQVGHWKNQELPDELQRLRERGGGSSGGGKAEWEVNLAIARATAKLLEGNGVTVDILPATVPPNYWADVFIAIHADGSSDKSISGFKVAAPRRDRTGKASELLVLLEKHYGEATDFRLDPNVTRNMRGYYAFNWRRYAHAIHPMTTAVILETGFLTSPADQKILIHRPEIAAQGITKAVLEFLGPDASTTTSPR